MSLQDLGALAAALAVVGGMLGIAGYALDERIDEVAAQRAAATQRLGIETSAPDPVAPPSPAPPVRYVSRVDLSKMCADEIRAGAPLPREQSVCALFERTEPPRPARREPTPTQRAQIALSAMYEARQLRREIDAVRYGGEHVQTGGIAPSSYSPENKAPGCFHLQDEKEDIDARMRSGYTSYQGEQWRGRLREIDRELCRLECVHC